MNLLKYTVILGVSICSLMFMVSCNSGTEQQETGSEPAENGLSERYNINAPDEELMNVDSAETDSAIIYSTDTAQ